MKKNLLVVGVAGVALLAAAQAQSNPKKGAAKPAHEVKSPRDSSTGQASGRSADSALDKNAVIHRDVAAREAGAGQATGKTTAQDDWNEQNAATSDGTPRVKNVSANPTDAAKSRGYNVKNETRARVAAGDVDGDGADASDSGGSNDSSNQATVQSDVKSPRDSSTGMATGKRQHKPISMKSSQTPNK